MKSFLFAMLAIASMVCLGCDKPAEACDIIQSVAVAQPVAVQSYAVAQPVVQTVAVAQPVVQSFAVQSYAVPMVQSFAVQSYAAPVAVASAGYGVSAQAVSVNSVRSVGVRSKSRAVSSSGGLFGLGLLGGSRAVSISR